MKSIKRKLSKNLAGRTRLSPDQLERVKGQAGEGLASRYLSDGTLSLQLARNLAKAKRKARKFVLYSDQLGKRVYISKKVEDIPLTFHPDEALKFFEGFDSPDTKVKYWNARIPTLKFVTTHE